ncbi:hypothetical protein PHISP_06735 [Aspergillus sp. HF37]|nr:hypothetical protein PHISP_06735 [Aspergillus sp. HF37]
MDAPSNAVTNSWQGAFDKLDPDLRAGLVAATDDRLDVIGSVLDEAERLKKRCLQKRWKIHVRGKIIILRDVFDKIISWVNDFKAIGDIAMQFDPAAASLPWAGVRFLLLVAISDNQCFESTVHGLESVTCRMLKGAFQSCQDDELKVITELDIEVDRLARLADAQNRQDVQSDV